MVSKTDFLHSPFAPTSIVILVASFCTFGGFFGINGLLFHFLLFWLSFQLSRICCQFSFIYLFSRFQMCCCYLFSCSLWPCRFCLEKKICQCIYSQFWKGSEIRWVCSAQRLNPEVLETLSSVGLSDTVFLSVTVFSSRLNPSLLLNLSLLSDLYLL